VISSILLRYSYRSSSEVLRETALISPIVPEELPKNPRRICVGNLSVYGINLPAFEAKHFLKKNYSPCFTMFFAEDEWFAKNLQASKK